MVTGATRFPTGIARHEYGFYSARNLKMHWDLTKPRNISVELSMVKKYDRGLPIMVVDRPPLPVYRRWASVEIECQSTLQHAE